MKTRFLLFNVLYERIFCLLCSLFIHSFIYSTSVGFLGQHSALQILCSLLWKLLLRYLPGSHHREGISASLVGGWLPDIPETSCSELRGSWFLVEECVTPPRPALHFNWCFLASLREPQDTMEYTVPHFPVMPSVSQCQIHYFFLLSMFLILLNFGSGIHLTLNRFQVHNSIRYHLYIVQ